MAPRRPSVKKSKLIIRPDRTRVLLRPFYPSRQEAARRMARSLLDQSEEDARERCLRVLEGYSGRHEAIEDVLLARFEQVREGLGAGNGISRERKMLIGSYFLMEYSPESTAIFNPSIVPHPDQGGLPPGSLRFVLSLRATGEGHISSIIFRTGTIDASNAIELVPPLPFTLQAERETDSGYVNELFSRKLREAGIHDDFSEAVMGGLPEVFIFGELMDVLALERGKRKSVDLLADRSYQAIVLLAESNYAVRFDPRHKLSQRILFPSGPTQSNGIEDARFTRLSEEGGEDAYYATYTAYDGKITLPQLLETKDFVNFKFSTLNGDAVRNKGMALFPRKIKGKYAMLSRQDDESIYVTYSDNVHFWYSPELVLKPERPWELTKIGTCGPPLETDRGWLVISHGVGPVRRYCIGAFLLDLEDPSRVIARLRDPLLEPSESERDGYVPNVVYTCGALLHSGSLVMPYAMSDYATKFALVRLDELLDAMEPA